MGKLFIGADMKILVINGSPKGKNSITLHTCLFLEKKFSGHSFTYIDAGQKIKALEKDFSPALEAVRDEELKAMIDRFVAVFPYGCDVINIEDFPFMGGKMSEGMIAPYKKILED